MQPMGVAGPPRGRRSSYPVSVPSIDHFAATKFSAAAITTPLSLAGHTPTVAAKSRSDRLETPSEISAPSDTNWKNECTTGLPASRSKDQSEFAAKEKMTATHQAT